MSSADGAGASAGHRVQRSARPRRVGRRDAPARREGHRPRHRLGHARAAPDAEGMRKTSGISDMHQQAFASSVVRPRRDKACACGAVLSQRAVQCLTCRRRRERRQCAGCGRDFLERPSSPRRYCCAACADVARRKGGADKQSRKIDLVCQWCGQRKPVSPVYASRRYCSRGCTARARSGSNSRTWKGKRLKSFRPVTNSLICSTP